MPSGGGAARAWVPIGVAAWLLAGCASGSGPRSADGTGATSTSTEDTVATVPVTGPPSIVTTPAPTTTEPPPPLTAAPGPFPVGAATLPVPADASGPALQVHVWYPAAAPSPARATYEIIPGLEIGSRLASPDLAPAAGRFPVVMYSHGSGAFSFIATFFTEILASHGYIVVAPDHPGDTVVDAFVRLQTNGTLDLVDAVAKRVVDLERVLAAVTAADHAGSGPLAGHVDPDHLMVTGHSLGGAGALEAAAGLGADAVVVMDPTLAVVPGEDLARVEIPVLVMTGSAWLGEAGPFDLGSHGPWYRLAIPTAPHASFTDVCDYGSLVPTWLAGGAPAEVAPYVEGLIGENCIPPAIAPARLHDLVDGYSLAFLRWALEGDTTWNALVDEDQPDATVDRRPT